MGEAAVEQAELEQGHSTTHRQTDPFAELVKKPIAERFAAKYGFDNVNDVKQVLYDTVLTVSLGKGQFRKATEGEYKAFLVIAEKYGLDPFRKQIFCFPKKGGGLQPIVGIDGWCHIINTHPEFNGMTFTFEHEGGDPVKGALISCTCTIHRKDRTHPIVVTEYYAECRRNTEPWGMKHRMLRHRALMQCGRYAFDIGGIMDEDEYGQMMERSEEGDVLGESVEDLAAKIASGKQSKLKKLDTNKYPALEVDPEVQDEIDEDREDAYQSDLAEEQTESLEKTVGPIRSKRGLYADPVARLHQLRLLIKEHADAKHFSDKLCKDCTGHSKKQLKNANASQLEKLWNHLAGEDATAHHIST